LENGSKYKNFGLNRFGREKNRTEPKLIGLNWFSVRFGSKTKNKIKSVWLYILIQNRTGPKMLSPRFGSLSSCGWPFIIIFKVQILYIFKKLKQCVICLPRIQPLNRWLENLAVSFLVSKIYF